MLYVEFGLVTSSSAASDLCQLNKSYLLMVVYMIFHLYVTINSSYEEFKQLGIGDLCNSECIGMILITYKGHTCEATRWFLVFLYV
ncbi:hypothetical protein AALP_AA5G168100 [Arabis alpina]|uniref:Uncharacterized protein n=1 Tax=Arabis alpina TaxID=50452 RepID=A0A087GXK8_ARAAL|nr:hypothetical protein AALP_AA5G168100 [Arabis alpina]